MSCYTCDLCDRIVSEAVEVQKVVDNKIVEVHLCFSCEREIYSDSRGFTEIDLKSLN